MYNNLSWQMVVSFIGGLIVFATTLLKFFKPGVIPQVSEIKNDVGVQNRKIIKVEAEILSLKKDIEDLKRNISAETEFYESALMKIEKKLEKVTDLIIDLIREQK